MDDGAMKAMYGPEYPNAVLISGVRMPLEREGRFMRHYSDGAPRLVQRGTTRTLSDSKWRSVRFIAVRKKPDGSA